MTHRVFNISSVMKNDRQWTMDQEPRELMKLIEFKIIRMKIKFKTIFLLTESSNHGVNQHSPPTMLSYSSSTY